MTLILCFLIYICLNVFIVSCFSFQYWYNSKKFKAGISNKTDSIPSSSIAVTSKEKESPTLVCPFSSSIEVLIEIEWLMFGLHRYTFYSLICNN